uniref:Orf177 n=1 Tax=Tolypocladium ophioglossoides TaxID=71617 RepID=A0A1C9U8D2_9HYPO|nr:orf177 [Tolypocladium ophioglossoides]AOR52826.1 orf177 [Tolypocladium ophioglossoides]
MSVFYLADKNNNINVGENTTVNINSTGGQLSLPINHLNKTAAAISAAGGASAGIQVAKYVAGPPAVKLAAGVTTAAAVQLTTTFMAKVLDSDKKDNVSKLTMSLVTDSNGQNVLNNYPLNLLFEINGLLICSLIFLYIIANIYISKYIISKDLTRFISPKSKIGKSFLFFLNKYLNLWKKSSNYLLGFCYVMLIFCIIICKFGLYLILL